MTSTRTSIARLALAVATPLLAATALAAPAQAQEAQPAPAPVPAAPSTLLPVAVPGATLVESQSARLAIPLSCKKGSGSCTFRIGAVDGTATAATGDWAARGVTVTLKAGKSKVAAFTVKALADKTCEPAETFRVQVQSQRAKAKRTDASTITIGRDADVDPICARQLDADAAAAAEAEKADIEAGIKQADSGVADRPRPEA
ncbi:hypothetical protein DSM112329_00827 [Paraconexibacter sp. AEG42_29]|uniref:Calx-beta domain-containing protein n=1 Tax=Paraconexibacter sp. AEG42_29 TaxID=2997339 RepID=A0AAU7AR82_9ACTN